MTIKIFTQHGYYVPHRLDYSTSGALIISRTKQATSQAGKSFEKGKVTKFYLAILRGHCQENYYRVRIPIGQDSRPEFQKIKMSTPDSQFCSDAKPSETEIKVLSKGIYNGDPVTKVLLRPLTGRRHQLRVHCHSLGHTILGDYTYSNKTDNSPPRMYLHAYKIHLPTALEELNICAGDPFTDFEVTEEIQNIEEAEKFDK